MDGIRAIQRAIDFIEDNIHKDLSCEDVARQAYMSSQHFQQLFSLLCGVTLGEYIRNRRLALAAEEIQSSEEKILDIALKYGYETPESFSRAFSRFHHISPTMVRRHGTIRSYPRISVQKILNEVTQLEEKIKQRGYTVGQVGPVYLTNHMERTAQWFEEVLGWYAGIETRDEKGNPTYGCAMPFNGELVHLGITKFNGFFLLPGEPEPILLSLAGVNGIDNLYAHVKNSGWNEVSEIRTENWGARTCDVTTVDGYILRFFEGI